MSRKKAEIQKDWDKATLALDTAIKGVGGVTKENLKTVQDKYKTWKVLLDEAVAKVGKWEGEQATDRAKFQTYVNTQKDKINPGYVTIVKHFTDALAQTDSMALDMKFTAEKVDEMEDKIQEIVGLLSHGRAEDAMHVAGSLETALKNQLTTYGNDKNLRMRIVEVAKNAKIESRHIDSSRSDIQTPFKKISKAYLELPPKVHVLIEKAEAKLEEDARKEPTSASQDPAYLKQLKKVHAQYNGVIDSLKAGLARMREAAGHVAPLEGAMKTITSQKMPEYVGAVVRMDDIIYNEFKALQQHFQDTVRTSESTYAKEAKTTLSPEDYTKMKPYVDRGITFSLQASNLNKSCHDRLEGILEDLVEKFNNPEAKKGLAHMEQR